MNRLCYALEKWDRSNRWERQSIDFDYSIMIDTNYTYSEDMYDRIKEVYLRYCAEVSDLSKFQSMCKSYDKYEDELADQITREQAKWFEIDWGVYYNKYRSECRAICPNQCVLANITVKMCYEEFPKKDKKFMWIVADNGIVQNIKQVEHKLPKRNYDRCGDLYMGKYYIWQDYKGDCV